MNSIGFQKLWFYIYLSVSCVYVAIS